MLPADFKELRKLVQRFNPLLTLTEIELSPATPSLTDVVDAIATRRRQKGHDTHEGM